MLPYHFVESECHEYLNTDSLDYPKVYLILIAASLLHQHLKLRAIGKMRNTLTTQGLVDHCIAMAGSGAHYLRVRLRSLVSPLPDSADMYSTLSAMKTRSMVCLIWRSEESAITLRVCYV
jgi:hypothetical protein